MLEVQQSAMSNDCCQVSMEILTSTAELTCHCHHCAVFRGSVQAALKLTQLHRRLWHTMERLQIGDDDHARQEKIAFWHCHYVAICDEAGGV